MLTKEALLNKQDSPRGDITGILHLKDEKKAHGITAGDLMTGNPVTVAPEQTVEHVARLMYKHRVDRLPVVDASGRLVGIISRADVLTVFDRADEEIRKEITDDVIVYEFLDIRRALAVMAKGGVVTLEGHAREQRGRPRHPAQGLARPRRDGRPRPPLLSAAR